MISFCLLSLLALTQPTAAVKSSDFKTCAQSGFCTRLRSMSARSSTDALWQSPYAASPPVQSGDLPSYAFALNNRLEPGVSFQLTLDFLQGGITRVRMDQLHAPRQRYNETSSWALLSEPLFASVPPAKACDKVQCTFSADDLQVKVDFSPVRIRVMRHGRTEMDVNSRGLMHMEHFRPRPSSEANLTSSDATGDSTNKAAAAADGWEWKAQVPFESTGADIDSAKWEEEWVGKKDSKPKGPEAFSLDIDFPNSNHVFGLPEHASPLSLVTTDGSDPKGFTDPYRMYNVDIFEYLAHSPMAMYGAVPLLHSVTPQSTLSILMMSASETWIDITKGKDSAGKGVHTHWMTESGILDLFILPGPTPQKSLEQYAALTGTPAMPQLFAVGYHQCRWNYISEVDVLEVDRQFDLADIPMDTLWLDIEYAPEHKYFQWDPKTFPDPGRMLDKLADKGRHLVAIVDPHVKRVADFYVYSEAQTLDLFVKNRDNAEFDGHCWTGSSAWVDFFKLQAHEWWASLFKFSKWTVSRPNLFIWNDMNEPSVFDGPEITMPKDNIHAGGWEHRDVHNINGMLFQNATYNALLDRESPQKRPFVLTRSYFVGSHRWGASWTGDNLGTWEHLAVSVPMLLSNNIAGQTFSGADVGGFFGNPSMELLARWYQAGTFTGFFRAHAHIDTKRREPYLLESPYRDVARDAIRLRYMLFPVWYTAFFESSRDGSAIMKPHFLDNPSDVEGYDIDDQYFVGNSGLLIKPIVQAGATSTAMYLPDLEPYYGWYDRTVHQRTKSAHTSIVDAPLEKIPLLIRGGSVVPIKLRIRRAAPLMLKDPVSLIITANSKGHAEGALYMDDGETFEYQSGSYIHRKFTFDGKSIRSAFAGQPATDKSSVAQYSAESNAWAVKLSSAVIERIQVWGLERAPKLVTFNGKGISFEFTTAANGKSSELLIKKPNTPLIGDWEIKLEGKGKSGDVIHDEL